MSIQQLAILAFFSHHIEEEQDHCVRVPLPAGRSLPVCARCLGIYPLAIGLFVAQVIRPPAFDLAWTDPWLVLLFPLPAVAEFLAEQLKLIRGSNFLRIATGIPLGIAMSRLFVRYVQNLADPLFWGIVLGYGGVCGLAAAWALRKRLSGLTRSDHP